ncbi:hypothetical protein [Bacillus cereus]
MRSFTKDIGFVNPSGKGTGESGIPPRYGERKITDEEYKALRKKHRQQK